MAEVDQTAPAQSPQKVVSKICCGRGGERLARNGGRRSWWEGVEVRLRDKKGDTRRTICWSLKRLSISQPP